LPTHVAQQGIFEAELLGPCFVGIVEVNTDTQHLGIGGLKLGEIKLEGQCFLRSKIGKGADVEKQHYRLLPQVIRQFDFLGSSGREGKVRRFLAHLERQALTTAQEHTPDQDNG
jgi:hypothetical protein